MSTWRQPKLTSSKLCPLSPYEATAFFFFSLPGNHHSINIPPKYKVLMSDCLLRLTLISPKVSEQGERKSGKKSCLRTRPADVVELLSSLHCPLVSLRDAWWQRWGSETCGRLRGGGSVPLRVSCHGHARPRPCATVPAASSVSTPYAPGRCREGTRGAVTRRPQLQSGDGSYKSCPLSQLILQLYYSFHYNQPRVHDHVMPRDTVLLEFLLSVCCHIWTRLKC